MARIDLPHDLVVDRPPGNPALGVRPGDGCAFRIDRFVATPASRLEELFVCLGAAPVARERMAVEQEMTG
jgi:hypothetical protein